MMNTVIRKGIVIENKDPEKKDRLKIRIIPEMKDIDEEYLPFILPKNGYGNKDSVNRYIPEINSIITVYTDDEFNIRNMRWDIDNDVIDNIKYNDIENNVNKINDKKSNYNYPQPNQYIKFRDGSFIFRNTETGEFVFYHNSGVYTIYDEEGNIINYTKNKTFKIYNDNVELSLKNNGDLLAKNSNGEFIIPKTGDVKLKGVSGTVIDTDALISIKNTNKSLKEELEKLWNAIISINTNLQSWVSTNCVVGSPVTPNPATLSLFINDNIQANINKTGVSSLLK